MQDAYKGVTNFGGRLMARRKLTTDVARAVAIDSESDHIKHDLSTHHFRTEYADTYVDAPRTPTTASAPQRAAANTASPDGLLTNYDTQSDEPQDGVTATARR